MFLKNILLTATVTVLLSSCAFFEKKAAEEPNHSWKPDANYYAKGGDAATLATLAYSQGRFQDAEEHVIDSLTINPKQPQALLVGALLYEQTGRVNRAKSYYEDLILVGGDEMSVLGTSSGTPKKITEIAQDKLRTLTLRQSDLVIEEQNGTKSFNISSEASQQQGRSAMEEALFIREQKLNSQNKAVAEANVKAVEVLFSDEEKNIISRFLIIKEMAESDMITKEEFLKARQANVGGLLPLTNKPHAAGIEKPVPSSTVIVDRINALKEAVESRAISSKEFSAERNLIVEAILPPNPRARAKAKAPAKDILSAAKEIRKIEVIYDLGIITRSEKEAEKTAVEKFLGLNNSSSQEIAAEKKIEEIIEVSSGEAEQVAAEKATQEAVLLVPNVTDPF